MPATRSTSIFGTYELVTPRHPTTGPLVPILRTLVALAIVAFGVQHVLLGDFVTRIVQLPPGAFPLRSLLARLVGLGLLALGLAIVAAVRSEPEDRRRRARVASIATLVVAVVALALALSVRLPAILANPRNGMAWTFAGKGIALAGVLLLVGAMRRTERRTTIGGGMLASFLVLGGIQHFIYPDFVATLVPAWMPVRSAWVYVAGLALVACGLGMLIPAHRRLAALSAGAMILLWVPLVHLPRALANLRDANEITALFEALAFGAAALLLYAAQPAPRPTEILDVERSRGPSSNGKAVRFPGRPARFH